VSTDPLGPVASAFDEAEASLRRAADQARAGWNDEARRAFDARHGDRIAAEAAAARRAVEQVRHDLGRALRQLGDG
jgi:hypothetical protein